MTRFVNTYLLVLVVLLAVSGILMLYVTWLPWVFDLHRIAAFGLVVLSPWKSAIISRSLRRGLGKTFKRHGAIYLSLAFAGLVVLVILAVTLWLGGIGQALLWGQTTLAWHWILGLAFLPLFFFHLWQHWPRPRPADLLGRRSALKFFSVAAPGWRA